MKVAAHPLVVAVAMGLLGPSVLDSQSGKGKPRPCVDCDKATEAAQVPPSTRLHDAPSGLVHAPGVVDPTDHEVESWLARPTPTPEAQARALADYLAIEAEGTASEHAPHSATQHA